MSYIKDNFLLKNKTAEKLYFDYAKKMPIFDYHCHLSEYEIYENKEFENIYQMWLASDHYKWRLMRNYGVDEEYITGSKSDKEKFVAYCKVLGTAFGNPLYHWSQMELRDYFNCDLEINEVNAERIWNECNAFIKESHITPQSLIEGSKVECIFTTNEIFDDLKIFKKLQQKPYKFKVIPAFRADKIMNIEAERYNEYVDKLGEIKTLDDLLTAIENRLQQFIEVGCAASDISIQSVYDIPDKMIASNIFNRKRIGEEITIEQANIFKGYLTYYLLKLYSSYHIRSELHIGAMRNNNSSMMYRLGPDSGFDSIAEENYISNLSRLLDRLNGDNSLPPMIIFNLNPNRNLEILSLIGCFQDSSMKGKIQYGAAWWFLDNKDGIEKHLRDLSSNNHLSTFIGMLTDSRSFLSYSRHHYFRRILCNFLGEMMENNEMTNDISLVGKIVEDISYKNAIEYFDIQK